MAELFPALIIEQSERVIESARAKGLRLAVVETVTAGLLSAALTSVSGASSVFERGYVLYHASAKATGVGVDPATAERYGAVSAEVTAALAAGLASHSQADAGVAITGYAGPTGGNERDPVGTIYIALFKRGSSEAPVQRHVFSGSRAEVKLQAVAEALRWLSDDLRNG